MRRRCARCGCSGTLVTDLQGGRAREEGRALPGLRLLDMHCKCTSHQWFEDGRLAAQRGGRGRTLPVGEDHSAHRLGGQRWRHGHNGRCRRCVCHRVGSGQDRPHCSVQVCAFAQFASTVRVRPMVDGDEAIRRHATGEVWSVLQSPPEERATEDVAALTVRTRYALRKRLGITLPGYAMWIRVPSPAAAVSPLSFGVGRGRNGCMPKGCGFSTAGSCKRI